MAADARRKGVGAELIDQVERIARAAGASRIYWLTKEDNVFARALYDNSPIVAFHSIPQIVLTIIGASSLFFGRTDPIKSAKCLRHISVLVRLPGYGRHRRGRRLSAFRIYDHLEVEVRTAGSFSARALCYEFPNCPTSTRPCSPLVTSQALEILNRFPHHLKFIPVFQQFVFPFLSWLSSFAHS